MLDPFSAVRRIRRPVGYEATLPRLHGRETQELSAWAGTLQLSVFVALVVLPLVLITGAWQAPVGVCALASAFALTRHSFVRYLRIHKS